MTKVAIITGASRGIGAATARLLAERGYAVCVNYHTNEALAQVVVSEITDRGGQAFACQGDVSREQDVIALFDATEQAYGPVTALVNNVGVLSTQSNLVDMDVEHRKRWPTRLCGCCRMRPRMSLGHSLRWPGEDKASVF